jgi:hypothetical protein
LDLSPVYQVSPKLFDFVLKSGFSSGDNLFETRDKLLKYGDKLSFSGVGLCLPELPELFFSIFIMEVLFFKFLSILIFIPKPFCRLVLIMFILFTRH